MTKAIRRLHTWSVAHKIDRNLKKGAAQIQETWHGKSKAKHTLCSIWQFPVSIIKTQEFILSLRRF